MLIIRNKVDLFEIVIICCIFNIFMGYIKEILIMKFDSDYLYMYVCLGLMKDDVIFKIGD